ncbi:MAG: hypothetical protein ACU0CI_05410, partial [Shimia sp.]
MKRLSVLCFAAILAAPTAQAESAAERWLKAETIKDARFGDGGTFADGVYRRDLDGDGRDDLILDHAGISCDGDSARSGYCGAQVCTMTIYLRRGDLLKKSAEVLGTVQSIGRGPRPAIAIYPHGGPVRSLRWTGRAFS